MFLTSCTEPNSGSCNNKLKVNPTVKDFGKEINHNLKSVERFNSLTAKFRKLSYAFK